MLTADGFDDAILGVGYRCSQEPLVINDRGKCLKILMGQGMDCEEANDYFCFNVEGAWMGEGTPIFLEK